MSDNKPRVRADNINEIKIVDPKKPERIYMKHRDGTKSKCVKKGKQWNCDVTKQSLPLGLGLTWEKRDNNYVCNEISSYALTDQIAAKNKKLSKSITNIF